MLRSRGSQGRSLHVRMLNETTLLIRFERMSFILVGANGARTFLSGLWKRRGRTGMSGLRSQISYFTACINVKLNDYIVRHVVVAKHTTLPRGGESFFNRILSKPPPFSSPVRGGILVEKACKSE